MSVGEPPGWFVDHGSLIVLVISGVAGAITFLGAIIAMVMYCKRSKPEPRPNNV